MAWSRASAASAPGAALLGLLGAAGEVQAAEVSLGHTHGLISRLLITPEVEGIGCHGSWIVDLSALGIFFAVVILIVRMRLRAEERRLDLAQRFVEQGMDPPEALFPSAARADLRRGIILLFTGLGLLAAARLGGRLGPIGLIPGFVGLGYIVSFALSQWLGRRGGPA